MALERAEPHAVHRGNGSAMHTDGEKQRLGQEWWYNITQPVS